MKTNELCSIDEYEAGYSAHIIGFGVLLYKNDVPYMQFSTESEMHEFLKEEVARNE